MRAHPRQSVCPACAERAKNLRAAQCREGWHLDHEPDLEPDPATDDQEWWIENRAEVQARRDQAAAAGDDTEDLDQLLAELDEEINRAGMRGKVTPDRATAAPVHPAAARRPAAAAPQGRPADGRQDLHHAGRQDVPAVAVPHPHLPVLRPRHRRRHTGRPGPLRLHRGRAGRAALRRAVRPVHPEPAPLLRL